MARVPEAWAPIVGAECGEPYFRELEAFVARERAEAEVFPADDQVFAALEATPYDAVRVVLLGQDPYPTPGHAHGMCFSVLPGVKLPGSLKNMYKELNDDLGVPVAETGYLLPWARQGVLLLNTVLTVRKGEANSHKGKGWERFTDAILAALDRRAAPCVFALWGNHAHKKAKLLDDSRHVVLCGPHPSPLSAKLWFGSKPFSQIDDGLRRLGFPPVDWRL